MLRRIGARPYGYDFYLALRLIECAHPDKPRIGASKRLKDDAVRLGQEASLSFAPSTVRALAPPGEGRPARLLFSFFGLLGPNGPLPLHLTEYARDRVLNQGDPTLVRFLDLFHHRMLSLFYRAWANAQPVVSLDRPDEDRFGDYLGALCGYGQNSLRERDRVPDYAKLAFTGLMARQVKNAESLAAMIGGYFRVPCRVEQCVGHWMPLPRETRTRLGRREQTARLGVTAVAGERVWDVQGKFRIVLGPLRLKDYERFLPMGESFKRLTGWVRNFLGFEYSWEVRLVLKAGEVPLSWLGNSSTFLGWTSWLGIRLSGDDAGDLVLESHAMEVAA
ncbi:MAG: type VI secretion system baseplate subunit TssG [Thiobacillaceae bacterium]|nr:type VI secretion system baseplate subunit TssG [Thiobacillaceae bacterium]